ncbi:hypothetical protein AVEN_23450-1 [Araneus ventricosus]|uniref:ATP-dependent DNA helicase n=1 Tax=Araneus ventricosus TaxID=182803 RepID=A0A4Y2E826_ARAVE|nr:hypothetical protein AVEN_23450-1 [Araneus ventricosus]
MVSPLYSNERNKPVYGQMYIFDSSEGSNRRMKNNQNNDEILTFLDGRYGSAPEAMWRLSEFSLSENSHVIMRLAVHLKNQQQVVFQSGQEVVAVDRASMRHTTFTAWFLLNQHDVEGHNYNYAGKVVLFGGGFHQVLPVVPRGSRSLTAAGSLRKHPFWLYFYVLYITKNIQALESEKEFSKWLLEVGDGLSVKLPSVCYPKEDSVKQLYNDLNCKVVTSEQLKGRAILTVTNDLSIELNNAVLNLIPDRGKVYANIDCILSKDP